MPPASPARPAWPRCPLLVRSAAASTSGGKKPLQSQMHAQAAMDHTPSALFPSRPALGQPLSRASGSPGGRCRQTAAAPDPCAPPIPKRQAGRRELQLPLWLARVSCPCLRGRGGAAAQSLGSNSPNQLAELPLAGRTTLTQSVTAESPATPVNRQPVTGPLRMVSEGNQRTRCAFRGGPAWHALMGAPGQRPLP